MRLPTYIARQLQGRTGHNTVNTTTVPIIFQRSPGSVTGNDRGISDIEYIVRSETNQVLQGGRTGADGKIDVRMRGAYVTLEIMHGGRTIAEYRIRNRAQAPEASTTVSGQQRRLRMLGYQMGTRGPEHIGVDGVMGTRTDRGILEFQADQGLNTDGIVGPITDMDLSVEAGV